MAQQYFVLGIGGTGMRCIESLLHLCGMGMFDDTDIYLLALDTTIVFATSYYSIFCE